MADETDHWDIAISFAARDEALALSIRDALKPPYRVFVYSKAQERLAGRDGVEVFRTVFRQQASLVVILFGALWGETPWTRVEKTAIEEFALESGWEHLLFVRLRAEDAVPKWVPKPHLYLDMVRFGIADLVGAIKLRLTELGTEARTPTPAERAAAQERRRQFDAETEDMLRHRPGTFEAAVDALLNAVRAQGESIAASAGWRVNVGPATQGGFAIVARNQSLRIISGRKYANSTDDTYLEVHEYDGALTIAEPGKNYWTFDEPTPKGRHKVVLHRLPEVEWCWEIGGRVLPPEGTAESIVNILLDRIETARPHR